MNEYIAIGRSVPHVEGMAKATGRAIYGVDLSLPGMLYGKILFSDRPHARIVRIDARRALALAGVKAVVTSADAPNRRYGVYIEDQLIFAKDRVLYVGEPVAAVAATSERLAAEAVKHIVVEYEDLPPVFDLEAAMRPDAPQLHPEIVPYVAHYSAIKYGNICLEARLEQGDVERGFAEADHIFEDTYQTQVMHQAYLEPHACVAGFDPSGRLTVWTTTQQVSACHAELAAALNMPMSQVRVIGTWLGGGFGGKLKSHLEPIAALLAKATGRPVKITLTREEEFTTTRPRPPYRIHLKTGVKNDGTIVAKQVDLLVDAGAYADHTVGTAGLAMTFAQGPYRIPNCKVEARVVYTNNGNWGCMRGYGVTQLTFATESQMDTIAHALGMDPADLRLKNLCQEGDPIVSTQRLRSVHIRETMEAALAASGYREKKGRLGPHRGIGIANTILNMGLLASSAAVRVNQDATVTILTSVTDIGSGTHTVLCQIAAEVLGIPVEQVHVAAPDSDSSPYDLGSIASRTTYDAGNAVRLAAEDARAQLIRLAAKSLGCSEDEIIMEAGRFIRRDRPERSLSFADLVGISLFVQQGPILGRGSWLAMRTFDPPVGEGYPQPPSGSFVFGTHVVEVEVDPETGQVTVLNVTAAHDVGKVINPAGIEGQVEGGVVQGIGYGLFEELVVRDGVIQNPSFLDYHIPTALDAPPIRAVFVEIPDPSGPFGAKGIGEPPVMAPAPAIANAIFDATGVRVKELPITPERLYWALRYNE